MTRNGHEGRVAVVTGAASGIGQAFAQRLAQDGAAIAIADLAAAADTERMVVDAGPRVFAKRVDISSPDDVEAFKNDVLERFGRVDILVNNAGIFPRSPWAEIDYEAWRSVMAVNLDGAFLACRAFVPAMQANGWGRVVNVCSTVVLVGPPGFVHYVASKAGVLGITRALASEVGESGVTVNAILPGLVRTTTALDAYPSSQFDLVAGLQAIARSEVPADLTGALSFLASDDAAFITGQALAVDGGYVRH